MKKESKIKEFAEKFEELGELAKESGISLIAIARDDKTGASPQVVVGLRSDVLAMIYGVYMGLANNDASKAREMICMTLLLSDSGAVKVSDTKKRSHRCKRANARASWLTRRKNEK